LSLLEVDGLVRHYAPPGTRAGRRGVIRAVDGISFAIEERTTFALVGESGCGKSTTARLILLLDRPTDGTINFNGLNVAGLHGRDLRDYKRSVSAVFQDPFSSLNPRMLVRDIVGEPLRIHERIGGRQLAVRVAELLEYVGLDLAKAAYYPHQFSGGQRQRIAIARALALNPRLIVLDEPVSALDVSIRAQILNLLVDLQERLGLAYLLISHDLAIVEHMSHDIAVMYAGQLVEQGTKSEIFATPLHPYTQALLEAVPTIDPDKRLSTRMVGEAADPLRPPSGCRFHPRCPLRTEKEKPPICEELTPQLLTVRGAQKAACHFSFDRPIGH
jgi:oligopeptide/dipeptide ABC transporter ATP-binding protein